MGQTVTIKTFCFGEVFIYKYRVTHIQKWLNAFLVNRLAEYQHFILIFTASSNRTRLVWILTKILNNRNTNKYVTKDAFFKLKTSGIGKAH